MRCGVHAGCPSERSEGDEIAPEEFVILNDSNASSGPGGLRPEDRELFVSPDDLLMRGDRVLLLQFDKEG